ncbi:MAG: hypothetical protein OXG66_14745 [Acidimicrobiaceae bacterium]|nr:hypothetical protein [Acidimicrobiaceae bacterium]
MPVGFWVFPWDIEDEGIDRFAARLEQLGVTSASPSVLYHSGRALLPRAREHKVRLLGGPGANYPFESLETPLAGMESESAPGTGKRFWQGLAEALSDRGIRLNAWAMPMHGSELGRRLSVAVVRNCFGNPYSYALCPSHPQARRFAESLVGELARSQLFHAVQLESVGYLGYRHFHHHEAEYVGHGPLEELFLSLCFCDACMAGARREGISVVELRESISRDLERRWRDDVWSVGVEDVREALATNDDLQAFISYRQATVASLVSSLAERCHSESTELHCFSAIFPPTLEHSTWIEGTDFAAWSQVLDRLIVFGYTAGGPGAAKVDEGWTRSELEYAGRYFDPSRVNVVLNLAPQYLATLDDARRRFRTISEMGFNDLSITNYGMTSETRLDWVPELGKVLNPPAAST